MRESDNYLCKNEYYELDILKPIRTLTGQSQWSALDSLFEFDDARFVGTGGDPLWIGDSGYDVLSPVLQRHVNKFYRKEVKETEAKLKNSEEE